MTAPQLPALPPQRSNAWYSYEQGVRDCVAWLLTNGGTGGSVDSAQVSALIAEKVLDGNNITKTVDSAAGTITLDVPNAATTNRGVVGLATQADTVAGAAVSTATTPAGVKAAIDAAITAAESDLVSVLADADQVVTNSATLVNDTHLAVTLKANTRYQIDLCPIWNLALASGGVAGSQTTTDVKLAWTIPAGTTGWWNATRLGWLQPAADTAATGVLQTITTQIDTSLRDGTLGGDVRAIIQTGSTAGEMRLRWAQNTATAVALTRLAGSNMLVRQLS